MSLILSGLFCLVFLLGTNAQGFGMGPFGNRGGGNRQFPNTNGPFNDFRNPNNNNNFYQQRTKKFSWSIQEISFAGDGFARTAIGVNGGAGFDTLIDVNQGDWVEIEVTNKLSQPTSIHFHGLVQNGTIESDGVPGITQCPIPPGKSYTYKWQAQQMGTFWWHGHYGSQYLDGLRGPLVIHGQSEPHKTLYDEERLVQLTDWYHEDSMTVIQKYMNPHWNPEGHEPVWSSGLVNGNGRYNCDVLGDKKPNYCDSHHKFTVFDVVKDKRYRVRIINMSGFSAFNVSLDGHWMTVIEVDGVAVIPKKVNRLTLNVGQRYSVVINCDQEPGLYKLRTTMLSHGHWTSLPQAHFDKGLYLNTGALWFYKFETNMKVPAMVRGHVNFTDVDDLELQPFNRMDAPQSADVFIDFSYSFHNTSTDPVSRAWVSLDFGASESTYMAPNTPLLHTLLSSSNTNWRQSFPNAANLYELNSFQVVQITIWNDDPGQHPFHMHGHQFWILDKGLTAKGTRTIPSTNFKLLNAARRDVVTVPGCTPNAAGECIDIGYIVLRFRADNPGIWIFHCHLQMHMKAGLAMVFVESGDELRRRGLNGREAESQGLCASATGFAPDTR